MIIVVFYLITVFIDVNGQIICLNRHNVFSMRISSVDVEINPNEQMKIIMTKLLNTTRQSNICLFQITLNHEEGHFHVSFENRSHYATCDEVLRTDMTLNYPNPWSTTFEGICRTDLCDRQRILNAARWMLFEGRTYFLIRSMLKYLLTKEEDDDLNLRQCCMWNDSTMSECYAPKCLALYEIESHTVRCLNSPVNPLVNIRTLVTFHDKKMLIFHETRFICTRDFCNREDISDEILRLTRHEFGIMSI